MRTKGSRSAILVRGCALFVLAAAAASAGAQPHNRLSFEEGEEGWMLLFDGRSLEGWDEVGEGSWRVEDGALVADSGEDGIRLLVTEDDYSDFELRVDFLAEPETNSGVFLRVVTDADGKPRDMVELNIAPPENPFPTGSLMRVRLGADGAPSFGLTERVAGVAHADQWRTFHVIAEGGRIQVELDGEPLVELQDPEPLERGLIGLQHNQGRIAFRNIKVRLLAW